MQSAEPLGGEPGAGTRWGALARLPWEEGSGDC